MAIDAPGIRIGAERTEAAGEALVVAMIDRLPAQVDHLVVEQRVAQLGESGIVDRSHVDADDLRPHRRRQRARFDLRILPGVIVELARRRDPHVVHG
jgi:hypothetical protein